MTKAITLTIIAMLTTMLVFGQDENPTVDAPLGLRIKRNGQDYLIYADNELSPNFKDYRKINYQVYFRKVDFPQKEIEGKKYQLISIPGSSNNQDQNKIEKLADGTINYPRAGKTISKEDYDKNFWIEVKIIENNTDSEFYKYANDVFSGLLTAPFKYRL